MDIKDIKNLYGKAPQIGALMKLLKDNTVGNIFLKGLSCSATPVIFSALSDKLDNTFIFILQDADEAGYLYHDLMQIINSDNVLFFPSGYKRAAKHGQRDSANEILRTEVLAKVASHNNTSDALFIVSYPDALAELVVSKKGLDERRLSLKRGQNIDITDVEHLLREYGFTEVDYVYEPGQFAVRGSILDVYSFSCEYPFRIDFFGDEIDTIRTFEVQDQLSKDKRESIDIVPELINTTSDKISFLKFLPDNTFIVMKDFTYIRDIIERIYKDGFSSQALTDRLEGATEMEQKQIVNELNREKSLVSPFQFTEDAAAFRHIEFGPNVKSAVKHSSQNTAVRDASITFDITPQPLFHKNFDFFSNIFQFKINCHIGVKDLNRSDCVTDFLI